MNFIFIAILFFFQPGEKKIDQPVHWSHEVQRLGGNQYKLIFKVKVDEGYGTYSQYQLPNSSVSPIEFIYEDSSIVSFIGKNEESGHIKKEFDPNFGANGEDVMKIKDSATFIQIVEFNDPSKILKGYVDGIVCDTTHCVPFDAYEFSFSPSGAKETDINQNDKNYLDQAKPSLQSSYNTVQSSCTAEEKKIDKSNLTTFLFGFIGGLLALLTPCVFPMIPLTVSYFTKSSKNRVTGIRNGLIYGFSIIGIYVGIGLLINSIFGATALNDLSTNWIANLIFFIVFVVFALSFFGYYEITLPSSWSTKTDSFGNSSSLIGIFFMAFTLAIVSFSCTGPIIGTALVQSATSKIGPLVVMFGFSLALALPFGLFAAFPAWLQSLPKSGSWMNSVKVVLGFLELALAFKFLSVADMTSHWGFLRYELFMAIWILCFAGMALYLFGFIKFPHDSPLKKRSIFRMAFASLVSIWTIYLITGFFTNEKTKTYHSLSLMSGLAPPAYYNFFKPSLAVDPSLQSKYKSYAKGANNLNVFKDYEDGIAYARETQKPVLLDFTGYGCVNCRKTEENIWVEDEIWNKLQHDFVLVSLYCDDDTPLNQMLYSTSRDKKIRNIGNKWEDFQIVNFQQNSQPLYVPVDPNTEEILVPARGYHSSIVDYKKFLQCAQEAFKIKQRSSLGAQ